LLPHLCQTCHSRESICFATNTHTHAVLSHHGREACSQPHLPVSLSSSRLTHICQSHTRWHCYHDVNCAFPLSVYLLGIQQHTSSRTHSTKPNTSSVNLALSDLQSHLLSHRCPHYTWPRYETTTDTPVGEVIDALVEIYNGILRIGRLAREVSCTSHQHAVICPI
jgi:hypothetical protein